MGSPGKLLFHEVMESISLEMVSQQSKEFPMKLEEIYTVLKQKIDDGVYSKTRDFEVSPDIQKVKKLIFDSTGIQVDIVVNQREAAIVPLFVNRNHVFLKDAYRGNEGFGYGIRDQERFLMESENKKGYVDRENGRVSGIYSEYLSILYMDYYTLYKVYGLSPAEVVAITLHELGHYWSYCENADRLSSTNQVLSEVAKELTSNDKDKKQTHIYKELTKINPQITEKEVQDLIEGKNIVGGLVWYKAVIGSVDHQLQNFKYDETSAEQLADSYAMRYGYGRALATGLDKMEKYGWNAEKSRLSYVGYFLFDVLMVYSSLNRLTTLLKMTVLAATKAAAIASVVSLAITSVLVYSFFRAKGEDKVDYRYDELKVRYQRMRYELVNTLKDNRLSKSDANILVEDIKVLDEIIEDTYKYRSLSRILSTFIFLDARRAKNSIDYQQELESLVNNDLFIKASVLKNMR
jgi:hypothetical protein